MAAAPPVAKAVTVFGGTGFLGRRVVQALAGRDCSVRVAARHPERGRAGDRGSDDFVRGVPTDLRDGASVMRAVEGADAVVNAVSLYHESGGVSFADIHLDGARRVAEAARRQGVGRLVSLSGIGADPASPSPYIRARGEGEAAVRGAFLGAALFRPSAIFGPGDGLVTALLEVTRMPVVPLFGRGDTRLQPVAVDDVAEAAARVLLGTAEPAPIYELGGPDVLTYRELVELALRAAGRRRPLLPMSFAAWGSLAGAARLLRSPPITEGMVALMRRDNLADPGLPGLAALGIVPRPIRAELERRITAAA